MAVQVQHGVRFLQHDFALSNLPVDEIRALANSIHDENPDLGCVVFPHSDDAKNVLVVFAGNLERFQMLSVARYARCKVVYFQDPASFWYQGSHVLPDILNLEAFIRAQAEGLRPVFFGQSSGGYASLVMSAIVPGSLALACSPQTGPDADLKQQMVFGPGVRPQFAPADLIDIRSFLQARPDRGVSAVFSSCSEHDNPISSHLWCDWLHIQRVVGLENLKVHVTSIQRHSIIFRNAEKFSRLIAAALAAATTEEFYAACADCLVAIGDNQPEDAWL